MTPKQKAFIESVVSMNTGKNRPVLETALKLYVMNEGLEDFLDFMAKKRAAKNDEIFSKGERIGTAASNAADRIGQVAGDITDFGKRVGRRIGRRVGSTLGRLAEAPSTSPIPTERFDVSKAKSAVESERFLHTWDRDYTRMLQACDFVGYFLKNYGNQEIMPVINSRDFKESLAIGDEIDRLRPSPMLRDRDRVKTYIDMVESIRNESNGDTVDAIIGLFETVETTTRVVGLTESAIGTNLLTLKNELAVIRNFNATHGSTPWRKWYREHQAEFAMGSRNNWQSKMPVDTPSEED